MWINNAEIRGDGIDNDNNGYIDDIYGWNFCEDNANLLSGEERYENDHGTSCAGIIAAEHNGIGIAGIAGNANVEIMSLKVLKGIEHIGRIDDVIEAINYAENMGAKICNLSLSVDTNNILLKNTIKNSNMLFIVSAGNGNRNIDEEPTFPASYDFNNVISVANIGFDGKLYETSNFGKNSVDVAAPGTYIYSTNVDNTYGYDTGSSMATPMVTGVASLMYLFYDDISISQIKTLIINSSTKIDDLKEKVVSSGILNGKMALSLGDDYFFETK